ncbi:UDP-N-acetylglucosamine 1-carboxyvinyltransferase [Rickettsia endosymbiont of Cardiosporidium cionae]|uniref:UDP-N-acetylglucosamine 1-carboxyvinyltransferase n=1 Tax=Rickettsia endosymbiont of Cardiosporidium cionae TaxID=2777155 RepID=UPI001893832D|nr:UDP-N-acetylglucosamine 1-carboxyvinyltransferase [Rickettsia endosymbiont of Cardiosporidium cionae]KAF8818226.1 UDP-N-acetylglucosamine 1-carboxyvinyltransferase [Rickettsia endosymbiont of Cardiosporidium cionae]
MDSIIINGGNRLKGEICISGSKNASLPIMAAAILAESVLEISNIPVLSDINVMKILLESHGCIIDSDLADHSSTFKIFSNNINHFTADYKIVSQMRASIWVLAPLLARFGRARVSLPGGCAIGVRQVDLHIELLRSMGATIEIVSGYIIANNNKKKLGGCNFSFPKVSVGATITAVLAAVIAEGDSVFQNCAKEPEIVALCECLIQMGAKIEGVGTDTIKIYGVAFLLGTKCKIIPDRIESGTYMIAVAIAQGDLVLHNLNPQHLMKLITILRNVGSIIDVYQSSIRIRHDGLIYPIDINTSPYPDFVTDLQPPFMSLMSVSSGKSVIHEQIFENRFLHAHELIRMGANIRIEHNRAIVCGVSSLSATDVMSSDLRGAAALILAALVAKGSTKIHRVYHLDRGYQDIERKLSLCGVDIKRIKSTFV